MIPIPAEAIAKLRRTFDDYLVEEVHRCNGIPHLRKEVMDFREAVAEVLFEAEKAGDPSVADHRAKA